MRQAAKTPAAGGVFAKVAQLLPRLGAVYQKMVVELVRNLRRDGARARLDLNGIVDRVPPSHG